MEETQILVVDDDEIVATTIERSLRAGGYLVVVAHSGVEALQIARRHPPERDQHCLAILPQLELPERGRKSL